jgi:two-component system LytT family response regulator
MQKPLTTIIVDDEARARRTLKNRLQARDGIEVVAEARNGRDALEFIRRHGPDLMFLDIQMPGMDGFDVLRALQPRELPIIIFVTMADDYATSAFNSHGLDYLLKPISESALSSILERMDQLGKKQQAANQKKRLLGLLRDISRPARSGTMPAQGRDTDRSRRKAAAWLFIPDSGYTTRVRQQDIEWIDAAGDYMCIHASGETHIMRVTMKALEQQLDPSILQRVHRSTIVNVHQVKAKQAHINGEFFLQLESGHTVKLSRSYKDKLAYFT